MPALLRSHTVQAHQPPRTCCASPLRTTCCLTLYKVNTKHHGVSQADPRWPPLQEAKSKSTPWGSGYRAPPTVLHGYSSKVTGKNAEERLDLRCAAKSDKFCK